MVFVSVKIFVTAKPNAKEARVSQIDETHFIVAVKEPPVAGRANEAILKAVAEYFGIAPSGVKIVSGHTSRRKILELP